MFLYLTLVGSYHDACRSDRLSNEVAVKVSAAIRSQHIVRPGGRLPPWGTHGVHRQVHNTASVGRMGMATLLFILWSGGGTEIPWFCFCNKFCCPAVGGLQLGM